MRNQFDALDVALWVYRFSGKVAEFDGSDQHLVLYDDGDEEWVNLATDKIKLAPETGESCRSSSCSRASVPLQSQCCKLSQHLKF